MVIRAKARSFLYHMVCTQYDTSSPPLYYMLCTDCETDSTCCTVAIFGFRYVIGRCAIWWELSKQWARASCRQGRFLRESPTLLQLCNGHIEACRLP